MVPTQDIFIGQTYFVGSNGQQIPLKVESVDFNPGYIGPEIHGYLFRDFEVAFSKKSDSQIKKVIFNDPATIVIWHDDTKTVVKCQPGDTYSKELGLAMCISKKFLGNKGNFNEEFKKWIPEEPIEKTFNDTSVGSCETCKYVDRGISDKPCIDCINNDGNKNNYKKRKGDM